MLRLIFLLTLPNFIASKGISKKIIETEKFNNNRFSDFVVEEKIPCEMPAITSKLPTRIRAKIELIWANVSPEETNCWTEMARTRHILLRLSPVEKSALLLGEGKECRVPSVVDAFPAKFQAKIADIWMKNSEKVRRHADCFEQQRKTRMLLLNLPIGYRNFRPPAFECALPHFYNRLETRLQEKLKEIWSGYKKGDACVEQIDEQIQLLEANDISLKSFQMPPPSMFRKRELLRRKLRRRANVA